VAADSDLLREHLRQGLRRVLVILTAEERSLLWRRFADDESCEAIARATGTSRSSIARRIDKLLGEVRDMLCLVSVSPREVAAVLSAMRFDAGLLDADSPTRPDPTRPERRLSAAASD
jgi:hypothetical protein